MMTDMMARFVESGFAPVEFDGALVHPAYTHPISAGDRVRVRCVRANSTRAQGIMLRLRVPGVRGRAGEGGRLRVEEAEAPSIALWIDSAPEIVDAECVDARDGAVLQVSNRWRLPDGREDEWLNSFGILIEDAGPGTVFLHCSDGYGDEPSFDDLIVELEIVRPAASLAAS